MPLVLVTATNPGDAYWLDSGFIGGSQTWAQTLVLGDYSGGTNPIISNGDQIIGEAAAGGSNDNGYPVVIGGGLGDGAGGLGAIQGRLSGNARGRGAVDLQQSGADADVAAGDYSTLVGGRYNTISATSLYGAIFGGVNNSINDTDAANLNYGSPVIVGG